MGQRLEVERARLAHRAQDDVVAPRWRRAGRSGRGCWVAGGGGRSGARPRPRSSSSNASICWLTPRMRSRSSSRRAMESPCSRAARADWSCSSTEEKSFSRGKTWRPARSTVWLRRPISLPAALRSARRVSTCWRRAAPLGVEGQEVVQGRLGLAGGQSLAHDVGVFADEGEVQHVFLRIKNREPRTYPRLRADSMAVKASNRTSSLTGADTPQPTSSTGRLARSVSSSTQATMVSGGGSARRSRQPGGRSR